MTTDRITTKSRIRRAAVLAWTFLAILAAAWLLPPLAHQALHLCPLRPDGTRQAEAFPSFARKYGVSCSRCHLGFPVLNAFGRQFKLNGYVMGKGDDAGVLQSEDKQLWTEKLFPIGLIVRSRPIDDGKGTISNQGTQMGGTISPNPNGLKSQPVDDVDFFTAGGDVARNISWMGEVDANPPGGGALSLGDLRLGYHPSQYANVVAMQRGFFVDDPYQTITGAESPTIAFRATDLALAGQGSLSGNMLYTTQQAMYVYGTVNIPNQPSFVYYAAGAAKDDKLGRQGAAPTNAYARLAFDNADGVMVGAFGGYGTERQNSAAGLLSDAPEAAYYATRPFLTSRQQFLRSGFDSLVEWGDLAARGAFVYEHDGDRFYKGAEATDRAAYVEAAYYYKPGDSSVPFLVPLIRENWYTAYNGKEQVNYVTAQVQHYFAPNFKGFVEYSQDTKRAFQGGTLNSPEGNDAALYGANAAADAWRGNRLSVQFEVGF